MNYTEEYLCDLEKIQVAILNLRILYQKRILITGASGMIGSAIVDFLFQLINRKQSYGIEIYVAGRSKARIEKRFKNLCQNSHFHFLEYDATKNIEFKEHFDYIIHKSISIRKISCRNYALKF